MRIRLSLIYFLCCCLSSSIQAQNFSRLVVFGDSWSDTGNAYHIAGEFVLPSWIYPYQRYSSGVTWVDSLASNFLGISQPIASRVNPSVGTGFAYGSAELSDGSYQFLFQDVLHVGSQIQSYLNHPVLQSDGTELVSIFAGGNNLLNGDLGPYDQEMSDLTNYVGLLYEDGVRHFMLPNMFDLSLLPQKTASDRARSDLFRDQFNDTINTLRSEFLDATFYVPDFYSLINDIYDDPEAYGFKSSLKDTSYRSHGMQDYHTYYLWVDDIHPSARLHDQLANAAYQSLLVVPEPTAVFLMSAFVSCATIRRKRWK